MACDCDQCPACGRGNAANLADLEMALRFRAVHGWDHWPTEEQMKEFEASYAEHMEHVRLRAEFLRECMKADQPGAPKKE